MNISKPLYFYDESIEELFSAGRKSPDGETLQQCLKMMREDVNSDGFYDGKELLVFKVEVVGKYRIDVESKRKLVEVK